MCKNGEAAIRRDGIWYAIELRRFDKEDVRWGKRLHVQVLVGGRWEWQWREGDVDVVFNNHVGRVAAKDAVAIVVQIAEALLK